MKLKLRPRHVEAMSWEESRDWVIEQAVEARLAGKITPERFVRDVDALLDGKTPVDADGWPLYYDPRILNQVNY